MEYQANSLGMRDRERTRENTSGKPRAVVMGDSFVEGWGNEIGDRLTDHLETDFDREFLNFRHVRLFRDHPGVAAIQAPDQTVRPRRGAHRDSSAQRFPGQQRPPGQDRKTPPLPARDLPRLRTVLLPRQAPGPETAPRSASRASTSPCENGPPSTGSCASSAPTASATSSCSRAG